jgi:pimeloyl-ACP methyl ester carboxylesterase
LTLPNEVPPPPWPSNLGRVRPWTIQYLAWDGSTARQATIVLPSDWGPDHHPRPLPLVISPHGRNGFGVVNAYYYWKELPADGPFALVCPEGLGRAHDQASDPSDQPPPALGFFTYGYPAHIDDLARMPSIVQSTLPWLDLDLARVYVLGSSMGGQETLLLAAKYPHGLMGGTGSLAGAAAFDSPCDLVIQCGYLTNQPTPPGSGQPPPEFAARMLEEVGARPPNRPGWNESAVFYDVKAGTQWSIRQLLNTLPDDQSKWDERTPLNPAYVSQLASLPFPLRLYWSSADTTVGNQGRDHTGKLYNEIMAASAAADVHQVAGTWQHSVEFEQGSPDDQITGALRSFSLIP